MPSGKLLEGKRPQARQRRRNVSYYKYAAKNTAIAVAGTTFLHHLHSTPDRWYVNHRGTPPAGSPPLYVVSVSATTIVVAAASGATTGDVFCEVTHSIVA
jgi:hypothetical protein